MRSFFFVISVLGSSCISSSNDEQIEFDEISRAKTFNCSELFLPKNSVTFVDFRIAEENPRHAMSLSRARSGKWIVHILEVNRERGEIISSKAGIQSDAQIQLIRITIANEQAIFWVLESDEVGGNLVGLDANGEVKIEHRISTEHFDLRSSFVGKPDFLSLVLEAYSDDKSQLVVASFSAVSKNDVKVNPGSLNVDPMAIAAHSNDMSVGLYFEKGAQGKWRMASVNQNGERQNLGEHSWELSEKPSHVALSDQKDLLAVLGGNPALGDATLTLLNLNDGSSSQHFGLGLSQVFFIRFIRHLGVRAIVIGKALDGRSILEIYDVAKLLNGEQNILSASVLDQLNRFLIWEEPLSKALGVAEWANSGKDEQGVRICKM